MSPLDSQFGCCVRTPVAVASSTTTAAREGLKTLNHVLTSIRRAWAAVGASAGVPDTQDRWWRRRHWPPPRECRRGGQWRRRDRKSTRLNSSHTVISYAVFCLKKKTNTSEKR